jgi:2'-5' RNA ligase
MDTEALYLMAELDASANAVCKDYYKILTDHGLIGTQSQSIPYHITLGSYETTQEARVAAELVKACQSARRFEIRMDHIGVFGLNVLYIEPNTNFELLDLRKMFFEDSGIGAHLWTAHTTMLMDEPDTILRALPVLAKAFTPFTAHIERLSLYAFFPSRLIQIGELL